MKTTSLFFISKTGHLLFFLTYSMLRDILLIDTDNIIPIFQESFMNKVTRKSKVRYLAYSLLCMLLLFCITSCENLNVPKLRTNKGSISFTLNEAAISKIGAAIDASRSASGARAAASDIISMKITLKRTSGSQLIAPVYKTGSLKGFTNQTITIQDIPLDEEFTVSIVIEAGNKEIMTGTSNALTLTTTETVTVSIKMSLSDTLSSEDKDALGLYGTWFFDYGYNQENAGIEEVTFNIDGTFLVRSAGGGYVTYEKGTYTVQDGSPKVLLLHITGSKDGSDGAWESIDVTNYYNIDDLTADELIMGRTKRDRSAMPDDNQIEYFDPPIYNHYYRMNSVTEDQLNGKWLPAGTGNQSFHSFSDDGVYMTTSVTGKYLKATYSLVQKETGTELHTIFNQFSDTITGPWNDIDSPPEYIYNIWLAGEERFILMQPTGSIIDGLTSVNDTEWYSIQYYDTELVTYTYHINVLGNDVTFTDRCPKGQAYTLPDAGKALYLAGVSESILNNIDILGYYTNQELSGNRVTSINATGNTSNRDFYVKFGLKCKKNAWYNDEENREDWNYETLLPANAVVQDLNRPATTGTQYILVAATLSDDIDEWGSIGFYASAENYWHDFSSDWVHFKSYNKHLYKVFEIQMDELYPEDANLEFRFTYSSEVGKVITLTDYDIIWLNDENSYDLTFHFGDMEYTEKAACGVARTLPADLKCFGDFNGHLANEVPCYGWYYEDGYIEPATEIWGDAGESKDVYMKYLPKAGRWENENDPSNYGYNAFFQAEAFSSVFGSLENRTTPFGLLMKAKLNQPIAEGADCGLALINIENDWYDVAEYCNPSDWYIDNDEYLNAKFIINPYEGGIPEPEKMFLRLDYGPNFYDGLITFTDVSFEVLYTINYHVGHFEWSEYGCTGADWTLPTDLGAYEWVDYDLAHSTYLGDWYENSEYSGGAITEIAADSVSAGGTKDVYAKYIPKFGDRDGWFEACFRPKAFIPDLHTILAGLNGGALSLTITAEIDVTNPEFALKIYDVSHEDGWNVPIYYTENNVTESGTISLLKTDDVTIPDNEDALIIQLSYGGDSEIHFTDFNLELTSN